MKKILEYTRRLGKNTTYLQVIHSSFVTIFTAGVFAIIATKKWSISLWQTSEGKLVAFGIMIITAIISCIIGHLMFGSGRCK